MELSLTKNRQDIEIMSPAGSYEAIDAAIAAGAGSVYFGVGDMNMRAAMNVSFMPEDLPKIAGQCKKHGMKSYLALNIVLYDEELPEAKKLVDLAKQSGISAIIACDHAILNYCREIGMTAHISTQANITNIEEVAYFSAFADTMVLGRELSLQQIANIVRAIEERQIRGPSGNLVRIEIFVHGYFCMAISGKCYISLDKSNASANRGECEIPCKRQYIVKDVKDGTEMLIDNEYIMSAKDLCTIDFIDKILETGAAVLKIEGRKKSADYVYVTTKCYKDAVDAYFDQTYTIDKIAEWRIYLATIFNRGFWRGYYLGEQLATEEWSGEPEPKIIKDNQLVAVPIDVPETGPPIVKIQKTALKKNDYLIIIDPENGIFEETVQRLIVDEQEASMVKPGELCALPLSRDISSSAKIYRIEFRKDHLIKTLACKTLRAMIGDSAYHKLRIKIRRPFS